MSAMVQYEAAWAMAMAFVGLLEWLNKVEDGHHTAVSRDNWITAGIVFALPLLIHAILGTAQ